MKKINKIFPYCNAFIKLNPNGIIILLLGILSAITLNRCGAPTYGIANGGTESTYLTKPIYSDTNANNNYISAKMYYSVLNTAYNPNEKMAFGEINVHRSHTRKNYNIAYAFVAYGGTYSVNEVEKYKGDKNFIGTALIGDLNYNIPLDIMDIRIMGLRTSIIYENGSYATFRKKASSDGLIINAHPNNFALNLSLTQEFIIKLKKVNFGAYNVSGMTFGKNDEHVLTGSQCIQLTHNKTTGFIQRNTGTFGYGQTISLGINYKFK